MALDSYVTLGKSGLRVSPFCLGTMTFGEDWGWGASVSDSQAILDAYIERGGNFIDTADAYTRGHSEKIIGDHIGRHPGRRSRMVIGTKFFANTRPGDPNSGGAGRKNIVHAVEQSLRRLQTDYIDLYWMHAYDVNTPIEETLRALDDLVRSGKVLYIGVCNIPAWKVAEAHLLAHFSNLTPFIALQYEYSLAERYIETDFVPLAQEKGLGIVPWSPLKDGLLSGKYNGDKAGQVDTKRGKVGMETRLSDKMCMITKELQRIAVERETFPACVALAWVLSRPGVSSTLIGARTMQQFEQNMGAIDLHLTADDINKLDTVSTPPESPLNNLPYASFSHGGMTINGVTAPVWQLAPKADSDMY